MNNPHFDVGNIVHVNGFTPHTSTGEVVDVDPGNHDMGESGFYCTVNFPDGEHSTFHEDELRLATDQELFVFLQGHDAAYMRRVILQQPETQLAPPHDTPRIDAILDAVSDLYMLQDYQMANLAEFLEGELRQKATRY